MEPSSYWETESQLTGQENRRPLWTWNVHYRVHNNPPLGLFLSQTYPVRGLISYCLKMYLITSAFTPRYAVCFHLKSYSPSPNLVRTEECAQFRGLKRHFLTRCFCAFVESSHPAAQLTRWGTAPCPLSMSISGYLELWLC